jgi:hypothetical protein
LRSPSTTHAPFLCLFSSCSLQIRK